MRRFELIVFVLAGLTTTATAGLFRHKPSGAQVPGGSSPSLPALVTPSGVVVPRWASNRIRESPVPLSGYSWGRRPWAFPLAQQNTPSARMARSDQLGFGAGPVPGFTNGPPLGNIPSAPRGTSNGVYDGPGAAPQFFSPWYLSPAGN